MIKYYLMHKDIRCGAIQYDEISGRIAGYRDFHTGASPFLGLCDYRKMAKWWEMRAVPASRRMLRETLKENDCINAGSYLAKNLALSLTDSYWICPQNMDISYDKIKLSNYSAYHDGKIPYHNATSYNPNASLGGQMEKYWDLSGAEPVLVKESSRHYGQQAVNEVFATHVHALQNSGIPFVKYTAEILEDRTILSKCAAFTSEHAEFVSAYEVIESKKIPNDLSLYDAYIALCAENGVDKGVMQDFMDYQTMTDFIISNTDEHLLNFGVLRDPDTLRLLGPAPVFDSGNSMFYSEERRTADSRAELLARKITAFYETEEKMLKKVKNRTLVKADLLPPPQEVKRLYEQAGLPEWKVNVIGDNYETKLQLFQEFQRGKIISLYHERKREHTAHELEKEHAEQKFIMLCGLPGSGKSTQAEKLSAAWEEKGYHRIDGKLLYSAKQAVEETEFIMDRRFLLDKVTPQPAAQQAVVIISSGEIQKELEEKFGQYNSELVFLLAEARVKTALLSKMTVIYDAPNLGRETRERFVDIAREAGVSGLELYIMRENPEYIPSEISHDRLRAMRMYFKDNKPAYSEGWTVIVEHD